MFALIFEWGTFTWSWYAELALRRRVRKSAIGSVMVMVDLDTFLAAVPMPGSGAGLANGQGGWASSEVVCGPTAK